MFRCPLCGVKVKTDPTSYRELSTPIGCYCPDDAVHPVDVCRRFVRVDVDLFVSAVDIESIAFGPSLFSIAGNRSSATERVTRSVD